MEIKKVLELAKIEVIEPESLKAWFPEMTSIERSRLLALISLINSNYAFENFYVFENVVRALNNIEPNIEMIEGCEPKWIWYAFGVIDKVRPNMEVSYEVLEYIKFWFSDEGIYFLPPELKTEKDISSWTTVLNEVIHKAEFGPFPIEPTNFLNNQTIKYMKMNIYKENLGYAWF